MTHYDKRGKNGTLNFQFILLMGEDYKGNGGTEKGMGGMYLQTCMILKEMSGISNGTCDILKQTCRILKGTGRQGYEIGRMKGQTTRAG